MSSQKLKDHRQIGQELDLFSFHDVAPGAIFWHPKGVVLYKQLRKAIDAILKDSGYQEVMTPLMVKSKLFKQSGHWQHFGKHNMFNLAIYEDEEIESGKIPEVNYTLKPMNCPESTLIYRTKIRSYKDLPLKFSDFGVLHRRELSGVLGGLFRVRQFEIDDAHLYVRPDQIQEEILLLIKLVKKFYQIFDFPLRFYLSTKPDKAMGNPNLWQKAEKALEIALEENKVKFTIKQKDGAFYGPKIDIHLKDSQKRDWQVATIQLDFQMPERFKLEYIDSRGKPKRPVMIHRAILGSFERFIGVLIEHCQGVFPLWLAPIQIIVIPIAERHKEYAKNVVVKLARQSAQQAEPLRVKLDNRNETMQAKIREATLQKVPYLVIIGNREIQPKANSLKQTAMYISVRSRKGKDLGQMSLAQFLEKLKKEIEKKI